jgi:Protein of unknown function (DUF2510)
MAESRPGWYSDPAEVPGRYRYWDGSRWTTITTNAPQQPAPTEPRTPSPAPSVAAGGAAARKSWQTRRPVLIVAVLVLALAAVVEVAAYVGSFRQIVARPAPTPTISGLAGSSPTPTVKPKQTPTATPLLRCPKGNPLLLARHPSDGRVHGGNLSFAAQPTFDPAAIESRFSFAYDVLQQAVTVSQKPPWIAQLAVGQLRRKDGFVNDARNTVESLAHCVISGNMYSPYVPTRNDIRSESLIIDGHSGWLIDSEIIVDRPDLQVKGDHTIFIVVRDGQDWGFFFGAVPIGNAQLDAVLAGTIRELHAS